MGNAPVIGSHAARLDDPVRYGRDHKKTDDPHQEEDHVNQIGTVEHIERIAAHQFQILLQRYGLNFRQHRAEQIGDRKPEIDADVPGEPLGQRRLKSVERADRKGQRPANRQNDQKVGTQYVYYQRSGFEQHFEYAGQHAQYQIFHAETVTFGVHGH